MTKVYITGGNSFLGRNVLPKLNKLNIDYFAPTSKEVDVLSYDNLSQSIKDYNPDAILHMAAKCGGILANKNAPADFLRDNTQMGLNIYEAARTNNTQYVYSIGSVCSYPAYCPPPFKESDIWNGYPEATNAPYGQAKRTLLMLSQTYREQYGIRGAFLIPVNMYGPEDHFNITNSHVIPALITKFLYARDNNIDHVECWGTGTATREFLYVKDAADTICDAIHSTLDTATPINIGMGKDISIKDLAYLIASLTNYTGKIIFNGKVSDGQMKRVLNIDNLKEFSNKIPSTKLTDGLKETIDWYIQNQ